MQRVSTWPDRLRAQKKKLHLRCRSGVMRWKSGGVVAQARRLHQRAGLVPVWSDRARLRTPVLQQRLRESCSEARWRCPR